MEQNYTCDISVRKKIIPKTADKICVDSNYCNCLYVT
jgi:hypothetical protein